MIKGFSSAIVIKVLRLLWVNVSPGFKEYIGKALDQLHTKAKETKNPFDDFIVEVLRDVLL